MPLNRLHLRRYTYGLIACLLPILIWITQTVDNNAIAASSERILRFDSEIVVNEDASLRVTEKIIVRAEGDNIERGIYRDFPLDSPFSNGNVPFKVLNVKRNGTDTHYWVEDRGDSKRINIYKEDVYLDPGVYTYTITYRTAEQLDFSGGLFANKDRLFWNVTGQNWTFPIDQASAVVHLPGSIPKDAIELNAFTGERGEKGDSYKGYIGASGNPRFTTTRSLASEEGLEGV